MRINPIRRVWLRLKQIVTAERVLYFAYGSNVDEEQMLKRCPSAMLICKGELQGYAPCFPVYAKRRGGGVMSVRAKDFTDSVFGSVWSITARDLAVLDTYEPNYNRSETPVLNLFDGRKIKVWCYFANEGSYRPDIKAAPDYLKQIITALERNNFTDKYIQEVKESGDRIHGPVHFTAYSKRTKT